MLPFTIDATAQTPPFEQLRAQVVAAVSDGRLTAGEKLPTVRALAAQLDVAPGTVARAYRELEASHIIQTRGRNGTFVATHGDPARQEAQRAANAYAAQIRSLGVDVDEAIALVSAALRSATG